MGDYAYACGHESGYAYGHAYGHDYDYAHAHRRANGCGGGHVPNANVYFGDE